MIKLFASIQILRPFNMILCIISVLIAAFLINGLSSHLLPYTVLVVLCFAGASNILNDVFDVRIDEINQPERVLPSGRLKILEALFIMSFLYVIGILACTYLLPLGQKIALITVLPLLVLYTPLFKRFPFIGNLVIGCIIGLVFLFTEGSINGNADKMWIPFLLATALSTIRELCKDAEDMEGDSTDNLQTFPKKFGLISTLWLLRILSVALCFFAIIPGVNGQYGVAYLITLILGVEIPLLFCVFMILGKNSCSSDYSQGAMILKGITIMGMFVIFSSKFSL